MLVPMTVGEEETIIKDLYLVLMKNQLGNVKECKNLIRKGHVEVNGHCERDFRYRVKKEDCIFVDGQRINATPFVYYMLYKPAGYICASRDAVYPCVVDLIGRQDCYCVGRLDIDTTGFVLLTNDASLSKKLLLPENHVEKVYEVWTQSPITKQAVIDFEKGVIIDHHVQCLPSRLEIIDDYHCLVTLKEGKYHQIKKMFLSISNQVVGLKRIAFAGIVLDPHLEPGQYRHFNDEEIAYLQAALR